MENIEKMIMDKYESFKKYNIERQLQDTFAENFFELTPRLQWVYMTGFFSLVYGWNCI